MAPGVFIGDTYNQVWCLYGPPDEAKGNCWYYKRLSTSRHGGILCFENGILYQMRLID
jgi:hypothetical protein